AHREELRLDMSRVCLSGGSAGANMTEIYAACVCNPGYAAMLGVDPVMTKDSLRVLAIDEAALDASVFDKNMYAMLGCATGAKRNTPETVAIINAKNYIQSSFIPSWINASNEPNNETGYFITEGRGLKKKLDEIGVPNDLVFFPGAKLPHGYMDNLDEPHGREAFERMMAFIGQYI
ncbi:MAG: alpha/beta hydrolase, partial [Clostridia bacterium]|nr:alpha/beta hydrolase [Clostridia bacterium]